MSVQKAFAFNFLVMLMFTGMFRLLLLFVFLLLLVKSFWTNPGAGRVLGVSQCDHSTQSPSVLGQRRARPRGTRLRRCAT